MISYHRLLFFFTLAFTLIFFESIAQKKDYFFIERFDKPATKGNYKIWNTYCNYSAGKDSNLSITYVEDRSPKNQVLHFSYKLQKKGYDYLPYAGIACGIDARSLPPEPMEGILYDFKGSEHTFSYLTYSVKDYQFFRKKIPASKEWTTVIIPFSELKQDGGIRVEFNHFELNGFTWLVRSHDQDTGSIYLDNFRLTRSESIANTTTEKFSPIIKSDSIFAKIFTPTNDSLFGTLPEYKNILANYHKYSKAILSREKLIDSLLSNIDKTALRSKEKQVLSTLLKLSINRIPADAIQKMNERRYCWREHFSAIIPYDTLCKIDRYYLEWVSNVKTRMITIKDWWQFSSPNKKDYPSYTVKNDTCFQKEIQLFNFKANDTIAEIGSGNAFFQKALSINIDHLTVYVNDIDSAVMATLAVKTGLLEQYDHKDIHYFPVLGTAKKSNLPEGAIDKIIIRNTFHHFSYPTEMVEDFKKVLTKDGSVFVVDKLMDEAKHIDCPLYMKRENFINYFTQNGFKLEKETLLYEEYKCFEFKPVL